MLTLGLMVPVWMALAKAWWMLGLPALGSFWRNSAGRSAAFSPCFFVRAGGLWLTSEIDAARTRALASLVTGTGLAPDDHPLGLEVAGGCEDLCLDLLSGPDLAWLRLEDGLTWRRAPEEACHALDPERAPGPCILASPEDTAPAELRIEVVSQNPGMERRAAEGLAALSALQIVTLTGPGGLHLKDGAAILSEVDPPFLVAAASWSSSGMHSSLAFARTSYLVDAEGRQPGFAMLPISAGHSAKATRRILARAGSRLAPGPGSTARRWCR